MINGRKLFSTSNNNDNKNGAATKQSAEQIVVKGPPDQKVADMKILRTLASYLWMKDNFEFRLRVIVALGLLVGAKVSFS